MAIDLAFANRDLERRFAKMVVGSKEEIGGILFWNWGRLNNLHFRTHKRLFGINGIGLVTDWIVVPNVSNLRNREYKVSDLSQLIAIAEQSADSRGCDFLHFHTHPFPSSTTPSDADLKFWQAYFHRYGHANGAVVAENHVRYSGFEVACHSLWSGGKHHEVGRFLDWRYINYLVRRDKRERAKKVKGKSE